MLLQNATAILLQNATRVYYKMRQVFYYKMRQSLKIAMILLQNATVITKCDVYYKLRQYNHSCVPTCTFHMHRRDIRQVTHRSIIVYNLSRHVLKSW